MNPTLQAVLAATASFFIITLLLAFILAICKITKRTSHTRTRTRSLPITTTRPNINLTTESATFDPALTRLSMSELITATKNFSPDLIIGDGSFGLVYKAKLKDGGVVAIKKLDPDAFQGFREFRAEMETLGKLKHENIVKILGYCSTGQDRVLIYDYMENGSVDQWLHDTSDDNEVGFVEWARRMVEKNREMDIVYGLDRENVSEENVKEYFRVALLCANEKTRSRPAIGEVAKMLEQISMKKDVN
ncbi:hypothetical protein ACFE04_005073 [Oxalis oulophora]